MIFLSAVICRLYMTGSLKWLVMDFRYVGQMTLTNYLTQNLAALLIFSGFGLSMLHRQSYAFHIVAALAVFAIQVVFSRWWLRKFKWGPLEWAWRALVYRRLIPNRI
jgi:uncharacterized protein